MKKNKKIFNHDKQKFLINIKSISLLNNLINHNLEYLQI